MYEVRDKVVSPVTDGSGDKITFIGEGYVYSMTYTDCGRLNIVVEVAHTYMTRGGGNMEGQRLQALMLDSMTIALDAHTASIDVLNKRIESLERWRQCKYGTYRATDEDVQEWSGRE